MALDRNMEMLHAAAKIALALGVDAACPAELLVELEKDGRQDWTTPELLLLALAQLAEEKSTQRRRTIAELSEKELAEALAAYATDEPAAQIAARFGITVNALADAAHKAGVRRPRRSRQ